jgi:RluA family pseudouridine synthase
MPTPVPPKPAAAKKKTPVAAAPSTRATKSAATRAKTAPRLKPGQRVELGVNPKDICTVIYADDALIAVDKAAGCPVVPTGAFRERSVTHALTTLGYGVTYPISLLDAEATGLVLLTRTPEAAKAMRWNWRSELCKREFVVVAQGDIQGARGRITLPIGSVRVGSQIRHQVMPIDQGGKPAVTTWKLIARGRMMSRLLVTMSGNRTHQIRIHLMAIGYPVVGDKRYGAELTSVPLHALVDLPAKYADSTVVPPHQIALHCSLIRIPHPMTEQMMEFTAPVPRVLIGLMPGAWVLDG